MRGSGSDTMGDVFAVILESGVPERLYTGLSLLVSAASAGEEARGLATFGALGPLLDPELEARACCAATHVIEAERAPFARTLVELRAAAQELPACRIWACAAAVQAAGADWATVSERLEGVTSIPSFLRDVEGARLVVV
jgi:peroxiredoxin family protein